MILRILPNYYFSLECLFLYVLLCFLYASSNQLPPFLSFLSIIVIGNSCLYFILKQKQLSLFIPFLAGIIAGTIAFFLGLTVTKAIICGLFITFRLKSYSTESSLWKEERNRFQILFYCAGLLFILQGWNVNYSYMNLFYGICIGFTILFSIGRFLQYSVNRQSAKTVQGLLGTLSIAAFLTLLISVVSPIGKWGIITVFKGVLSSVAFLVSPFFNLIEKITIKPKPKGPKEALANPLHGIPKHQSEGYIVDNVPSWIWIVILIIILIGIGMLLRRYKKINIELEINEAHIEIEQISIKEHSKMKRRFFKQPAPSEHVRKLIFQLQKFAKKYNLGRHENETVKEWFHRAKLHRHEELLIAYEEVRYGSGKLLHNDEYYEHEFQKLKQEIKDRYKEENKN